MYSINRTVVTVASAHKSRLSLFRARSVAAFPWEPGIRNGEQLLWPSEAGVLHHTRFPSGFVTGSV